jgi:hypothetical protein
MLALVIILSLSIILAITAIRWGKDSRDGINSSEWERRRNSYYAMHRHQSAGYHF